MLCKSDKPSIRIVTLICLLLSHFEANMKSSSPCHTCPLHPATAAAAPALPLLPPLPPPQVGLYTSPHLLHITERISVLQPAGQQAGGGGSISAQEVCGTVAVAYRHGRCAAVAFRHRRCVAVAFRHGRCVAVAFRHWRNVTDVGERLLCSLECTNMYCGCVLCGCTV